MRSGAIIHEDFMLERLRGLFMEPILTRGEQLPSAWSSEVGGIGVGLQFICYPAPLERRDPETDEIIQGVIVSLWGEFDKDWEYEQYTGIWMPKSTFSQMIDDLIAGTQPVTYEVETDKFELSRGEGNNVLFRMNTERYHMRDFRQLDDFRLPELEI